MSGRVGSTTTGIIADGLVFNMDAANRASYVPNATSSYNTVDLSISGSFINDPTYIAPPTSASCWNFDGVDDCIGCGNDSSLQITGNVTVSSWFKTTNSGDQLTIAGKGYYGSLFAYQTFRRTNNQVAIMLKDDSGYPFATTSTSVTDGNWHSVIGVKNGTDLRIYLDGVDEGNATCGTVTNDTSEPFSIGADNINGSIASEMVGDIASVQVYNRALSANEVLHNYNALKGRFS